MSNISDLDALMSDLDSARRSGGTRVYAPGTRVTHSFEMSEKTMSMSDRDSRDSPLRDRSERSEERSQSPLVSRPKSPGQHRKMQPGGRPGAGGGASGATRELDDLMASLNDFKVENNNQSSNYQSTTTSRFTESTQRNYTGSSPSPARDVWDKGPINRGSPLSDSNSNTRDRDNHNRDTVDRGGAASRTSDLSDNNTCAACNKTVSGQDCRKAFESGSFFELDGRPYCEQHYHSQRGSVCGTCQQPISGRCITAMGKKFHPDHFVCSYCVRPLNKGTFKEHAGKPWCHNCFERLYGSNKEGQTDDGADM